ncbi:hypothetical protein E9993_07585 [Labilibacter sediminis]|nr:hypothetical protein E9993_07585 [Labilibacter sediminis]
MSSFIASRPDVAEAYVVKMAAVYRYIIDNVNKNKVSLVQEIQFIQDYFYLHKLRDEEKIQLKINVSNKEDYKIIPVSLQILIENALKHNMASATNPLLIDVYLDDSKVVVKNNLQRISTLDVSLKKGLKNLKERVFLTTGKNIEVKEDDSYYTVKVPLIA